MTQTKMPVRSPLNTNVLNTCAISSLSCSATCAAARCSSSTSYGTSSYAICARSNNRAALVLLIFIPITTTAVDRSNRFMYVVIQKIRGSSRQANIPHVPHRNGEDSGFTPQLKNLRCIPAGSHYTRRPILQRTPGKKPEFSVARHPDSSAPAASGINKEHSGCIIGIRIVSLQTD